jgi:eIF-2B alpha/beta/delta-like uncharacterized protein
MKAHTGDATRNAARRNRIIIIIVDWQYEKKFHVSVVLDEIRECVVRIARRACLGKREKKAASIGSSVTWLFEEKNKKRNPESSRYTIRMIPTHILTVKNLFQKRSLTMITDNLQSLRYTNDGSPSLSVLDQLKLPMEKVYIEVGDVEAAWSVIRSMQIRGAPLIAIVAVLGLAVDLNSAEKTVRELDAIDNNDKDSLLGYIQKKMDYLATARPTAVNVFHALDEVKNVLSGQSNRTTMCQAVVTHAEFMLQRDVSDNKAIGKFGAEAILKTIAAGEKQARIVTICNTGSLATAGYGTALGVVRALAQQDRLESITALETRPYNQGSRLTAFEILEESMPGGTLICDSMAGSFMKVCGLSIVFCAYIFCPFSTANSLYI